MAVGPHNLARLVDDSFQRNGDYESLFFEGSWYRSGDLYERVGRLAGGLKELGIQPDDRVVVMMSNCPEIGMSYNALWRIGAAITPVIFLLPPDELRHIVADSEARAVITTPEFTATVKQATEGIDTLKWIISAGPEEDGIIPMSSLEEAEPAGLADKDDSDMAALMYTGGTTGRAKGVMLSHENLWWGGKASYDASHVDGINRNVIPLPLSHSFGLLVTVVGAHSQQPGVAALQRWFDPTNMLELIQDHQAQQVALVPSMLQMLLAMPLENYDLSSLRYIVSGASPLALEVVHEFERRVPNVEIREGYGLTETSASLSVNRPNARRLGSVGQPLPGVEVKFVDDDDVEVAQGEPGEICCKSDGVMLGYWRSEEATADATKGGWFHTGDIGKADEDGYLWILDRKKDLIIRGGFNVYPRDVEDCLLEHPAVSIAGVVGKPDPVRGEEVVAFVSLSPGQDATPEELIEFAKGRIGGYKYPRDVRIVGNVPLTPVGKIDRKVLRTML
ncbi:MAG: long-chain acyl-CoA synthetase [Actinomycetota bacterium]|jgi:long-chain acyl-CoA synthetase|nr:long-chain acyl-CoA synthetase [Actinomycetota bacterium]